jgi:hypothetical protein
VSDIFRSFGALGQDVNYVIVKNYGLAGKFEIYDQSNVRKDLLALGAREIAIPALDGVVRQSVDRASLSFSAFAEGKNASFGSGRGRGCALPPGGRLNIPV